MSQDPVKVLGKNRKAYHNYHVDEKIECGIVLFGTEVKSLRKAHFNFADAYGKIRNNELFLVGLHINPFAQGNMFNHEPDRDRKLLLHKQEILKLKRKVDEKGFTLIPLELYLKEGKVKVQLGVCRGKKLYDKRQDIKSKDLKRETDREIRGRL
jgi:SsrA-binding protein